MIIKKITTKTTFKPAFGAKKGTTEFYQAFEGRTSLGEIEVNPRNKMGKPEIMSVYTDVRDQGVGKFLVQQVLSMYLNDIVYVRVTNESAPFWKKM